MQLLPASIFAPAKRISYKLGLSNRNEVARVSRVKPSDFLSVLVSRAHRAIAAQGAALLKHNAGIPLAQWRIILVVGAELATTAGEIVAEASLDPAQISRTLRAMEDDGLVETRRARDDRRVIEVLLTAKGREIFDRMVPIMQTRHEELLGVLNKQERDALQSALIKIREAAAQATPPK
jgi:DNA-binding MarR family transcriptional regulator